MKKLISFILLAVFGLSVVSFASNIKTAKALNFYSKELVTLSAGETKTYEITIPDNKFYAVETIQFASQELDTCLTVCLGMDTLTDDDSGNDYFSFIGFNNQAGQTIQISVQFYEDSTEGSFYLQVRRQQAVYYGAQYDTFDSRKDLTTPYNAFSSLYDSYKYENESVSHFTQDDLVRGKRYNSEIMFFSGHGEKVDGSAMYFYNGSLSLADLGDMRNVRLAVWSACSSANSNNDTGTSFTHKSVNNGAKSAIGFPGTVASTSARSFTNDLFTKLAQGSTVASAASYAAGRLIWPWDDVKDYVIAGDSSVTLNTPSYTKSNDIVIITTNNDRNEELTNNYNDLISNHDYVCMQDGNVDRYYLTINGVLTNQFIDVANRTYPQAHLEQNYTVSDNVKVLPILLKYNLINTADKENHLVYVIENNVATPILISYVTCTSINGGVYVKTICKNLNDGSFIDYAEICSVKRVGELVVK